MIRFWSIKLEQQNKILKHVVGTLTVIIFCAPNWVRQVACLPFFGEYEYVTAQNGPVWILGSAIFYDYVVQYAAWADEKTYCFFVDFGNHLTLWGRNLSCNLWGFLQLEAAEYDGVFLCKIDWLLKSLMIHWLIYVAMWALMLSN